MNAIDSATDESGPAVPAVPLRLSERCTERLCYTQGDAPTGEHAFGHFIVGARVLADALWEQIDLQLLDEAQPADIALHRWLRHPEPESDQATRLPAGGTIDATIEQLFNAGQARAFCACCNRNISRHEVVALRPGHLRSQVASWYRCPDGHLLLRVETGGRTARADRPAA